MKTRRVFPFIFAVTTVAGCAVGPDYHPPKTQAPANWSEAQLGGETNAAVSIMEWWKTFNDPELNSLIERAVATKHDVGMADGRLRQGRAPSSGGGGGFGRTNNGCGGRT